MRDTHGALSLGIVDAGLEKRFPIGDGAGLGLRVGDRKDFREDSEFVTGEHGESRQSRCRLP
jgi:hypothetical protein